MPIDLYGGPLADVAANAAAGSVACGSVVMAPDLRGELVASFAVHERVAVHLTR